MIPLWLCKAKHKEETSEGKFRTITREFLVESHSYTESEARAIEIMGNEVGQNMESIDIKQSKYTEYFRHSGEVLLPWWKVIVHLISYDENKRRTLSKDVFLLVQEVDIFSALLVIKDKFNNDYVRSIEATSIIEIYPSNGKKYIPQIPRKTEQEILTERFGTHGYKCYMMIFDTSNANFDEMLIKQIDKLLGDISEGQDESSFLKYAQSLEKENAPHIGETAGLFVGLAIRKILNR